MRCGCALARSAKADRRRLIQQPVDIVAHTLWAAAGMAAWSRQRPIAPATIAATIGLAALPDILQLVPIALWWIFGDGTWSVVQAYGFALPGQEPALPPLVLLLSHHLHCVLHSLFAVAAVTLVLWLLRRALWIPLLGWWSHIVIDVFTHSADYYPAPVLYPITERGFDGIAWNTPWSLALNYAALGAVGIWFVLNRKRRHVA